MMPGASGMPTTVINNTFNPTGPTGTGSFNPTGKFVVRINEDCDVRREPSVVSFLATFFCSSVRVT